jgi:hypothetical protein
MTPLDDPGFGHVPHMMPNFKFECPICGRPILIYKELPILPPGVAETTFDLSCPHPKCGWKGTLRGEDADPWPPPDRENV